MNSRQNLGGPAVLKEPGMLIETHIPLAESILGAYRQTAGAAYEGYRNHVYRMIHFCLALKTCGAQEKEQIVIAGCFHDLGIWLANTVDYIEPSIAAAMAYLKQCHRQAWSRQIALMIREHHKIRPYGNETYPLVELFRRGDLVDVSSGRIRFGIPLAYARAVRAAFPDCGFFANLGKLWFRWLLRHPLDPVPMMKW